MPLLLIRHYRDGQFTKPALQEVQNSTLQETDYSLTQFSSFKLIYLRLIVKQVILTYINHS